MTWWDHKTQSIWSQPWGRAIGGVLEGTELALLPSQVTLWANWKAQYPDTLVMTNDTSRLRFGRQGFSPDFVIGLVLGETARAYAYAGVAQAGVLNDHLGPIPVVVWAGAADFRAYVRSVAGRTLTFRAGGQGRMVDEQTGSVWDISRGLAVEGELAGEGLQPVPSMTAYDWAWLDFYPESDIYEAGS
jgi:hypothetical protein